jgi:O-antigen/teichoic acid export membrane protein
VSKRDSYRQGFIFGAFSFVGATVVGLISTVVTSRLYGVDIVGEFALVAAPVAALWVLSTVKEQQALIKEITGLEPRTPRVNQLFAVVFTFSWALTAVVGLLTAIVCWFVFRGPLGRPELVAPTFVSIAGYVVVTNTCWNLDSVFSAFVAGRILFWVTLHQGLSFVVLAVGMSFVWHSVWGLTVATIAAFATSLVHRLIAIRHYIRPHLTWSEFRQGLEVLPELLRFGIKATPGQIAQGAVQQGGVWALGLVASTAVVGAYSRAVVIPRNLQTASVRITAVLYPTLVGRHQAGDGHGFDRAMIDSIRYEVIGMLLIAAAIGGAADYVLKIFGPGFSQAAPALILLMLYPAFAGITVTQTQALWATDRPALTSWISGARLFVNLALLIVLTQAIGIAGPAIAMVAGEIVYVALAGLALRRTMSSRLRDTWKIRERLVLILAYAAGFGAAYGTEQALPFWPGVIACLAAGSLAFVAVFLLGGGLNHRDRERVEHLLRRVRRRRQAGAGLAADAGGG